MMRIVKQIRSLLTDDLRKPKYKGNKISSSGHCYIASEAIYHLLGGKKSNIKPMFVYHENEPHWSLKVGSKIIDPTFDQFKIPIPYNQAKGKGFLNKKPSLRSRELIRRYKEIL